MNASADLQVSLAWPRCGLMQSPTLLYVALGQNCLPAHCWAVQIAFDRIVEQPTDRSPEATCCCKQARTRPPPGLTPAHRDWMSVVQSRSVANNPNPSCALAPQVPVSSNPAPNTIAKNDFVMVFALMSPPNNLRRVGSSPKHPEGHPRIAPQQVASMKGSPGLLWLRCSGWRRRGRFAGPPLVTPRMPA
jgi:hypothetical protein